MPAQAKIDGDTLLVWSDEVAAPKAVAAPELFVTVAATAGLREESAPENVSDLLPVYEVTVFPEPSRAVTVRFWVAPAVMVDAPIITRRVAPPATIWTFPDVPALLAAVAAVNVVVPTWLVYFSFPVTFATPETKSENF